MAIGLLEERLLTLAAAPGPGNLVVLFGSATGRDGIGGASVLASATFTDDDPSKRPSVQVGDPFAEKLLIEASLELIERGLVEGLQDLGAGGITCATSETADRAGTGIVVDLDAIPRREPGMEPFEVMISESQERMCAIVRPDRWEAVREVCERWGLPVAVIGRVTADGDITVVEGGLDPDGRPRRGARELARIPARALTSDAIVHQRLAAPPDARRGAPAPGAPDGAATGCRSAAWIPGAVLLALLGSPNLASRHAVFEQYDSTVGADTVAGPGRGAAVLRVKGTTKALVATTDGNQAVGAHRPVAGRGAERRRGDPQRLDHRRAAARRDELPQLRRPDPARGVLAADRGRARARRCLPRARPAGHRRQRLALQRVAGRRRSRRRPRSASSGCSTTSTTLVGPAFAADGRRDPARRRGDARARPARAYAALAGSRRGGRPAGARPRARGGAPGASSARRSRAASSRRRRTSRAAASRSRSPSARCGAGRRRAVRARRRALAGRRPVRREPVAARPDLPAAARARRSAARPPARPAGRGRSASVGGDRLVVELAGAGATGAAEERGSRRRRRARGPARATSATPGSTGWPAPSAGRADGDVRRVRRRPAAAASRHGGRVDRGARAVRAPAPRPGIGRRRGQRRRAADALQGPRHDQHRSSTSGGCRASAAGLAIAHCRYSTTGSTIWENAQPTFRLGPRRALAIGHNGNLVNTRELLDAARAAAAPGCRPRPTRSS